MENYKYCENFSAFQDLEERDVRDGGGGIGPLTLALKPSTQDRGGRSCCALNVVCAFTAQM